MYPLSAPSLALPLIIALALPLVAQILRPGRYSLLPLASAAAFAISGAAVLWALKQDALRGIVLSRGTDDRVFHDTYYVTTNGYWFLNLALCYLALAIVLWAQGRWLSHPWPRLVSPMFWVMHIGVLSAGFGATAMLLGKGMPRRYLDYEDAIAPALAVQAWSSMAAALALGGVGLLFCWAALVRIVSQFRADH